LIDGSKPQMLQENNALISLEQAVNVEENLWQQKSKVK